MAWTNGAGGSRVSRAFLADVLADVTQMKLTTDTFKAALYDNSTTPNADAASSAYAYGAGVWATAGGPSGTPQVYETGQWDQGGKALTSVVLNSGTAGVVFWDAADLASGSAADLAGVCGTLVYDDSIGTPVAKQGVCHNSFGGANTVVNGTFTIVWNSLGIFRATV